ncbi:MAG TPA: hypothetical protein VK869_13190 [Rubrobacteraceae bacterium]|nr:hypothetical protein [Rubrobacteraceae bacterium]
MTWELPEVTSLHDARGERPPNAAGVEEFWYEPEVWALPLSPVSLVLYAGLCSFLGRGEINRRDLRNTLIGSTDAEIAAAFEELVERGLLYPRPRAGEAAYEIRSVKSSTGEAAT